MIGATLVRARQLVDELTTAGIRATADPRNLRPPGVLLERPALEPVGTACTAWQATWTMHIVVPGGDNTLAWERLDALTAKVLAVIGPQGVSISPGTYEINDSTDAPSTTLTFLDVI